MVVPSTLAWKLTLLFGMLGTGAINTLSKKIQNQSASVGIDGKSAPFSKPWSQTLVMFSGEACLIFVFFIQQYLAQRAKQRADLSSLNASLDDVDVHQPLLSQNSERDQDRPPKKETTWKTYFCPVSHLVLHSTHAPSDIAY
jgi:hypothetical protein